MTVPARPERCVIVVDEALPPGLAANAAAVLALSIGARFPELPGRDLMDADGSAHPGLIPMGLPVLSAPAARLTGLRAAALDVGLDVFDFPTAGQQTIDYEAFAAAVAQTSSAALAFLGVALCGPNKPVRKLTGGFRLLR
jgi:hypothetical protein